MAYQSIGSSPRIYLNIPEYLATNDGLEIDPVFRTLPVSPSEITSIPDITASGIELTNKYIAILGHDGTLDITLDGGGTASSIVGDLDEAGYTILSITDNVTEITSSENSVTAGSILLGTYFDFGRSPDLNVSLNYSYDGVVEQTTIGGSTLTNSNFRKPSQWGNLGAWEFGGNPNLSRSGRRNWSINFSFMAEENIYPDNLALENFDSASSDLTLLEDDTIQRVIHLCNGSQLPFLFQPDSSNVNSGLAICKFDQNSFKFSQTAPTLYNVSFNIKEIW